MPQHDLLWQKISLAHLSHNLGFMCTVLYCTVLYCTVLYCTVLYCTVLYCTVLYCTVTPSLYYLNYLPDEEMFH